MRTLVDEVWVLTRSNNQIVIEKDPLSHTPGLHFLYYDLSRWALKLKRKTWFLPVYFILWQWGAYRLAARSHRDKPFDCVYHVTFASMKFGSFMGRLGIPFVIGPIAGGERAPLRLRRSAPIRDKAGELLRDLGILFQRYSPLIRPEFAAAERIYVTTQESLRLIPHKWHFKTAVCLAIGTTGDAVQYDKQHMLEFPRFVYAGNLLFLKGIHLAIRALAQVRATIPDATLTLFGDGPAEQWLRNVAKSNHVEDAVEFAGHLPRKQLLESLQSYTALVFPSLHDSGGMVVLEALSKSLPVICLDLGGPGAIVNASCGIVVPTTDADEAQAVTGIANAMISLGSMPATEMSRLSAGAVSRANELSWDRLAKHIIGCTEQ
jgi:glycosyltransferase involved in cell wall biosynthesis